MSLLDFIKKWMLVIGMVAGAAIYLIYRSIPQLHPAGPVLCQICTHLQPVLLFTMLFLTFNRIEPRQMKPHRWQWSLLLVQGGSFCILAVLLALVPDLPSRIGLESFMLCMICPTATACAVVTDRLGGDMAGVLTYTILINIVTAILVPLAVPLIHPVDGMNFFTAFSRILSKVFPLLILPCLTAWLVRYLAPNLHRRLTRSRDLSFYIWAFSLTLAILMSTRALCNHEGSGAVLVEIAAASLLSCIFQFAAGKAIGAHYDSRARARGGRSTDYNRKITAGQSLGQKNTVFAIWMGYTFLDPVTSLAGGFYSIWHNCFNTWQLNRMKQH